MPEHAGGFVYDVQVSSDETLVLTVWKDGPDTNRGADTIIEAKGEDLLALLCAATSTAEYVEMQRVLKAAERIVTMEPELAKAVVKRWGRPEHG